MFGILFDQKSSLSHSASPSTQISSQIPQLSNFFSNISRTQAIFPSVSPFDYAIQKAHKGALDDSTLKGDSRFNLYALVSHGVFRNILANVQQVISSPAIAFGLLAVLGLLFVSYLAYWKSSQDEQLSDKQITPPTVHIPADIQLSEKGHQAYADALENEGCGDVVIIPRHGRKEYVVDHKHVRNVLTDSQNFSFERAVTNMLHMEFMLWFKNGTFVQELDGLVQDGVTPRLKAVIEKVSPIFSCEANAIKEAQVESKDGTVMIEDVYEWVHRTIAQAMVVLILGEQYLTPKMTENFMAITVAISHLAGIYENTQGWRRFPSLWSLKTTLQAIFGTVVPRFFFGILPKLWKNRFVHLNHGIDVEHNEYAPFFDLLVSKHRNKQTGSLSLWNFVWCATVSLGIIFASIHQTAVVAVWCIMTLSQKQDEYLEELRKEWKECIEHDDEGNLHLTINNLRQLEKTDSFIREVMRTKGDTFAPVRYTIRDVQIGRFVIPKNSLCAPYVRRAHEHFDNYGEKGATFDGFQWYHQNRPAVQGGHDFISFGLGRWACPGRHLAIAELKMVILMLFAHNEVQIKNGTFHVSDPMNTTSVAPSGILEVRSL